MANIDELKGLMNRSGGVARGNLFRVELPILAGIPLGSRDLDVLCSGVSLPGRQIMTAERQIGTITQKVAYSQLYDDITLSFHIMNDYKIKTYFEVWQNLCLDQNSGELGYTSDYAKSVKIHQLKKGFGYPVFDNGTIDIDFTTRDQIVYSVELFDAFPTTMNAVELGDGIENAGLNLGIQLSYRKWRSTATPTSRVRDTVNNTIGTFLTNLF